MCAAPPTAVDRGDTTRDRGVHADDLETQPIGSRTGLAVRDRL